MSTSKKIKKDRMQIRIDANSKELIERAAEYSHKSISDFVISYSLEAAERIIKEQEKITLSDADWDIFFNALLNPNKPNKSLKKAYRNYLDIQK